MSREDRNHVDRSTVSKSNTPSYILTYYRRRNREPSIALGSHHGGVRVVVVVCVWGGGRGLIFACAVPHRAVEPGRPKKLDG